MSIIDFISNVALLKNLDIVLCLGSLKKTKKSRETIIILWLLIFMKYVAFFFWEAYSGTG